MATNREALELAIYAILGASLAILPFILMWRQTETQPWFGNRTLMRWQGAIGVSLSLLFFATLFEPDTYVLRNTMVSPVRLLVVGIFWALFLMIFAGHCKLRREQSYLCWIVAAMFLVAAIILNFSSGPYTADADAPLHTMYFESMWYHWGAYIASAKSLASGLAIYRDFPSQYGLGPSIFIAAASGLGWVAGMFIVVGVLQLVYWVSISVIGLVIANRAVGYNPMVWISVLLVTITTCFLWAGSPTFANFFPSLGGARYFPAALLSAAIILLDLSRDNYAEKRGWRLHILWGLGAVWSVESLFIVSFIWWPQYLLLKTPNNASKGEIVRNLGRSMLILAVVAIVTFAVFLAGYYAIYKVLPDIQMFLAFASNVPGSLPVNIVGPALLITFSLVLSLYALGSLYRTSGINRDFRTLFCVMLLSYGAMVYYIGRSHDSNILSLFPYHGLIWIFLVLNETSKFIRTAAASLLALSLSWICVAQHASPINRFDTLLTFNGTQLDSVIENYYEEPVSTDRGRAIDFITSKYGEGITAFDIYANIVLTSPQKEWTSYNNATTYAGLPSEVQKLAVHRARLQLNRQGWVIIPSISPPMSLAYVQDLFAADYEVDQKLAFDTYTAYRFVPKR
ncbi:hypothetical protein HQ945_05080 [Phyllobacterium sp. BT25]|uniref:Glycosyltransferase RgtA/B/C/D-like domain-containing protein n=1 Tax=Phyllobacterium pellucidum TaxID=2740464 RepID=A0A849VR96_9HYPH|nr:hypothetical protein [Phyllobacterium pellucidum]NTS30620.1 hypothetical protein [Phyllobacterium pellucidum]